MPAVRVMRSSSGCAAACSPQMKNVALAPREVNALSNGTVVLGFGPSSKVRATYPRISANGARVSVEGERVRRAGVPGVGGLEADVPNGRTGIDQRVEPGVARGDLPGRWRERGVPAGRDGLAAGQGEHQRP